ncbi:hypothetical protein KO361_05300 [Candidatus Woesearchaeota archaeon]|nr:hypothetical protein [Candidatus Woesearchaeota archaeon]
MLSGGSLFLMAGKVVDYECDLREYGLVDELSSPMQMKFCFNGLTV